MQISGSELLSNLGLVPKPQPGGPKPQAQSQARQPAQDPPAAQAARDPSAAQAARAGSPGQSAGASRARDLEQAVQALSDQGSLPPRGSLVDLRA